MFLREKDLKAYLLTASWRLRGGRRPSSIMRGISFVHWDKANVEPSLAKKKTTAIIDGHEFKSAG